MKPSRMEPNTCKPLVPPIFRTGLCLSVPVRTARLAVALRLGGTNQCTYIRWDDSHRLTSSHIHQLMGIYKRSVKRGYGATNMYLALPEPT